MNKIISQPTRKMQLQGELYLCNMRAIARKGDEAENYRLLGFEVKHALNLVDETYTYQRIDFNMAHPWHEHQVDGELMTIPGWCCPICKDDPDLRYDRMLDIEAAGVQ